MAVLRSRDATVSCFFVCCLCDPLSDNLFLYFTTWYPYKLLRMHRVSGDVRTIAGLPMSRTPDVPVPIDGYPPNSALAYPTTVQASLDGQFVYVFEYLEGVTSDRYDRAMPRERYQVYAALRQISLATGFIATIPINDGGAPIHPATINLFAPGSSTNDDFEQPHAMAFARSASLTTNGVDGTHLCIARENRVRVLALNGAPVILDIRPRVVRNSGSVTLTLTGAGFGSVSTELIAIDYRDQDAFSSTDVTTTGSAMPTLFTCSSVAWISSTQVTCSFTLDASLAANTKRLAFRVHMQPTSGNRLVSRHAPIDVFVIPQPKVVAVTPNTGRPGVTQRVVLTSSVPRGFGTGLYSGSETVTVVFGSVGSGAGT